MLYQETSGNPDVHTFNKAEKILSALYSVVQLNVTSTMYATCQAPTGKLLSCGTINSQLNNAEAYRASAPG
jgi:hypothetical protein